MTDILEDTGFSFTEVTGNDVQLTWAFSFVGPYPGYIRTDDISIWVRDSDPESEDYGSYDEWGEPLEYPTPNNVTTVTPLPSPLDDAPNVRIRRIMPKSEPYADTNTDDIFRKAVLNNSFLQQLYIQHEVLDGYISVLDLDIIDVDVSATSVRFNPSGTSYDPSGVNVDSILREIDSTFLRQGYTNPPTIPPGGEIPEWSSWLVQTSNGAQSASLPANPSDGAEILIRDDEGFADPNTVTILNGGNTIMGTTEPLLFTTGWAWCVVKYFDEERDWRVIKGGVGAQVVLTPSESAQALYPPGHVLMTMNPANPVTYLNFGIWRRVGNGRFIAGAGTDVDADNISKNFQARENPGSWTHRITIEQMPEHDHDIRINGDGSRSSGVGGSSAQDDSKVETQTGLTGASQPLTHTAPTFAVYMWERTQ